MSQFPHTCNIQKRSAKKKFAYSGATGTPVIGQTVKGLTSAKTAVIDKTGAGYLIVKSVSGTFTVGETIAIGTEPNYTFTATLSSITDYKNQSGEYEYYWSTDQSSVPCRFYYSGSSGKGAIIHETGQLLDQPLKCAIPPTCTVTAFEYRIYTTTTGFSGTYDILKIYPLTGVYSITHYEAVLAEVST
jgi:hypothetical protein